MLLRSYLRPYHHASTEEAWKRRAQEAQPQWMLVTSSRTIHTGDKLIHIGPARIGRSNAEKKDPNAKIAKSRERRVTSAYA